MTLEVWNEGSRVLLRKLLAPILAVGMVLSLVAFVTAHHTGISLCGTVTFVSEQGFSAELEPGDLTFGPFGPGEYPTSYVFAAPVGTYTYQFFDTAGQPEQTGSVTVTACDVPSSRPTPTVKPTPHVTPRPTPRPAVPTGPPTDV